MTNCCLKVLSHGIGLSWKLLNVLEKRMKGKWFWTGANWLLGWCMSMHELNLGRVEAQGFCGCRRSHLRTGLWATTCYAYNGLCLTVQPHVSRMGRGTWLNNLQSFTAVVPLWCVGGLSWPMVFYNRCFPPAQEGAFPAGLYPKGRICETLTRRGCGGMMHCKGLVVIP